ncbi:uncharacterized protein AtWU_06656 [Aspergillus tubingensis]|nr:uncharacterized protein AtWU_06656 [Aspergillus tubingensis]GFN16854.1 hypothetical protein AtWU_06656 [Aspergillus tubingensis]GLA92356.1 hypothetical protein AtubIFM57143_007877 [Aspergillus tubingensis]
MVEGHIGGGSYSQDTFPIEVEALCAMGPREPLQGPENVGHQQSAVTDSRLEVYDRLSPLLFQLTRDSQALKRVKLRSGAELESVFFSVSALCDIIHTIALSEQGLGLQSCGFYSFQSRNETVVLALTAVLIVLEIYELLAHNAINDMPLLEQTKSGEREVLPIFSSGQQSPSSHASPGRGLHTYGRLDTVVRYTVMDFHLGQLRRLLEFNMEGSTSWQPNAIYHLESTRGRLDALRMWIQDLVSQA